jgi:hypothetical protein
MFQTMTFVMLTLLNQTAPVQVAAHQRPLVLLSPQLSWVRAVNEKSKLNPETGRSSSVVRNDTSTPLELFDPEY